MNSPFLREEDVPSGGAASPVGWGEMQGNGSPNRPMLWGGTVPSLEGSPIGSPYIPQDVLRTDDTLDSTAHQESLVQNLINSFDDDWDPSEVEGVLSSQQKSRLEQPPTGPDKRRAPDGSHRLESSPQRQPASEGAYQWGGPPTHSMWEQKASAEYARTYLLLLVFYGMPYSTVLIECLWWRRSDAEKQGWHQWCGPHLATSCQLTCLHFTFCGRALRPRCYSPRCYGPLH